MKALDITNISQFSKPQGKPLFINDTGHSYKVSYNLGRFSKVTAEQVVNEMKTGRIFPLTVIRGTFSSPGNRVVLGLPYIHHLTFLPYAENEVQVKKVTKDGVFFEALPNHIFQGTVFHKIQKCKDELFYIVEGQGIPNESYWKYYVNLGFAKLWPFFIKMNVLSTIKKLDCS